MNPEFRCTMAALPLLGSLLITSPCLSLPSYGVDEVNNNCAACHGSIRNDRMRVTPQELKIDIGTQLDGSSPGSLNAFAVEPGTTVVLSMDVLNGSGKWSAQLKQMEKGGQAISLSNSLVWSQSGNSGWRSYGSAAPYMTTTVREDTGAQSLDFSLTIDASTPPDTYDLVFAIAGKSGGLFYQEEHFYLEVTGGTWTWAGYEPDAGGNIDTGNFLSWIQVSADHPWIWVYSLGKYIYLPEDFVSPSGGWTYIPN